MELTVGEVFTSTDQCMPTLGEVPLSTRGLVPAETLSHVEPHEIGGLPSSNKGWIFLAYCSSFG